MESLTKRALKLKKKEDIEARIREKKSEVTFRLSIRNSGKPLISDFLRRLETLLKGANDLPGTSYLNHINTFQVFFETFRLFLTHLRTKLKQRPRSPKAKVKEAEITLSAHDLKSGPSVRSPEISMLSDESFIFNWSERLEAGFLSVESFLRNTLVIIDRAGGGKTNLICHLVQDLSAKQPVILLFGKEHFDSGGLVQALNSILFQIFPGQPDESVRQLDRLLEQESTYLTIFIDGINENRHLTELDNSIAAFLEWAREHRIRIVATCRDIYWDFFDFERWEHNVSRVFREQLNQFSPSEYEFAVPLYLEYYNIDCSLTDVAKEACHHPLLLRFFCEAYGAIEGETVNLGEVRDIRLKELFDVYIVRKTDQIRKSMGHRNSDLAFRYLSNLVLFLFKNLTTVISTAEIEEVTGEADTSTQNSLYLHLLDEDIIIEEQPGEQMQTRRVTFVYEEFMEYLLALSIIKFPKKFGVKTVDDIFRMLKTSVEEWVNARGVAEYVALMLLGNGHKYLRKDAIRFLHLLTHGGKIWCDAFWSAVGKCSERHLGTDLFDEFSFGIDSLTDRTTIEKTLGAMSRYDVTSSNKLAAIILWTSSLPRVISWSEITQLPKMAESEINSLADRLRGQLQSHKFSQRPRNVRYDAIIQAVIPHLDSTVRQNLENTMKMYGNSPANMDEREFLYFFWKHSPEYGPFLINGLFCPDQRVRTLCADRLRFVKQSRRQVSRLCYSMADVETDPDIQRLLKDSAYLLTAAARKEESFIQVRRRTKVKSSLK